MGWQDAPLVEEGKAAWESAPEVGQPAPSSAPVTPTPPAAPSMSQVVRGAGELGTLASPVGIAAKGMELGSNLTSKAAYKAGQGVTDVLSSGRPSIFNPWGIKTSPEIAALSGAAANVGVEAIPAIVGGVAGKEATLAKGQQLGRRWMQQALQPSKAARESGDATVAIENLLTAKEANLSKGGVERMTAQIDKLDDELTQAIQRAGGDVSTKNVMRQIKGAIAQLRDGLDQAQNSKAVKQEFLKFFTHPNVQQAFNISAETAQKMKRAIYDEIGARGFATKASTKAAGEAGELAGKKAVAAGLNEEISRVSPEAAAINKQMAPIIKARDLAAERVSAHGNKMDVGMGWLISHPWAIPGWMLDRSPYLKSIAARAAYRGTPGAAAGGVTGGVAGAVSGMSPREAPPPAPPQDDQRTGKSERDRRNSFVRG